MALNHKVTARILRRLLERMEGAVKAIPEPVAPAVQPPANEEIPTWGTPATSTAGELAAKSATQQSRTSAEVRAPGGSAGGAGEGGVKAYDGAVTAGSVGLQVAEGLAVVAAIPAIMSAGGEKYGCRVALGVMTRQSWMHSRSSLRMYSYMASWGLAHYLCCRCCLSRIAALPAGERLRTNNRAVPGMTSRCAAVLRYVP